MDQFPGKPGVSYTEVVVVVEQEEAVSIVICFSVGKGGANR